MSMWYWSSQTVVYNFYQYHKVSTYAKQYHKLKAWVFFVFLGVNSINLGLAKYHSNPKYFKIDQLGP